MTVAAPSPTHHDVVVIGASAGGVEALVKLARLLPPDFPAAICVVQHIPAYATSHLPELLSKAGPLPARHPRHQEPLRPGTIYVAPPDQHLLLDQGRVLVTRGPKENRFRPSVDALFRSAAHVYGPRVIGVVLTGYLDDGTSGLWTIQRLGGLSIVQSPEDAYAAAMPSSALEHIVPDYVVPLAELAPLLVRLTAQPAAAVAPALSPQELERIGIEVRIAKGDHAFELQILQQGQLTPFICPDCQGPLVQLMEGHLPHFRCRTGHSFTLSALLASVSEKIENQLYAALQSLEEAQQLLQHMGEHFTHLQQPAAASLLRKQAEYARQQAALYQSLLKQATPPRPNDPS